MIAKTTYKINKKSENTALRIHGTYHFFSRVSFAKKRPYNDKSIPKSEARYASNPKPPIKMPALPLKIVEMTIEITKSNNAK